MLLQEPLLAILRRAHCRHTHHHFALDALPMVQTDSGQRLTRLLLRHHKRYLMGATDPDTRFRDYQNHVIHVTEGYWGGAPRVAHQWYDRMLRYLRTDRFADAAHAAGVLSHYFTDPMQPLHTQQCERERILHRPIEWSVYRSYGELLRHWKDDDLRVVFQLSDGPGWLGEAMLHGARFANRKYHKLLDEFDLLSSLANPVEGLHPELQRSLAELIGLCVTGWARVLERAASDAEAIRGCRLPSSSLTLATALTTMSIPSALWLRWTGRWQERAAVAKLVSEYRRTGTLSKHLPTEVDIVHRVARIHHDEVKWKHDRQMRLASKQTIVDVESESERRKANQVETPSVIPFVPREPQQRKQSSPRRRSA